MTQRDKALAFEALHAAPGIFVIPNPWDVASARVLAGMGFPALATSSAASAIAMGKADHQLTRDEALAHARLIVEATALPVSADLENGFGDAPETVAETVRMAAGVGLVGCTIEDAARGAAMYDVTLAAERIAAAVEAARALPFPFVLTARAHNLLFAPARLEETIERLQAYERAGADVLFAPALADLEAVKTVCAALRKPFNFMAGMPGKSFSVGELAAAGVKRVSLATALYRAAMTGFMRAALDVKESGQLAFIDSVVSTQDILARMRGA